MKALPKQQDKGKFNIVDFVIIAVIVALMVGGVYKVFFVNKNLAQQNGFVEFGVYVEEVRMPTVESIYEGQQVRDVQTNIPLGKIKSKSFQPYREPVPTWDGQMVAADVPEKYDVIMYIESPAIVTDNSVMIGTREIKTGGQISVKSNIFSVTGVVYGVNILSTESAE